MSRKEIRIYSNYRGSGLKTENEPEEGEIVDEYDLIVSSDEELSMRQRIRELEAENEEIEQIAVISRSYEDKIHPVHNYLDNSRAAQVPTDVSSISSTEFFTPKKRKREKSREHKRRHCHHQHQRQHHHHHQHARHEHQQQQQQKLPLKLRSKKTHCKRRQKLLDKHSKKLHSNQYMHKNINAEPISIESLESSEASSSSLTDNDSYSTHYLPLSRKDNLHDGETYITRDTLRLAVARNSNDSRLKPKKSCLKDKLLKQKSVTTYTLNGKMKDSRHKMIVEQENDEEDVDDDDDVQVIETEPYIQNVDEDSTDSMEEKELRLIALKSAVLKKHMARKIRNAEAAYSPTDFDDILSSDILHHDQKLEDLDIVDLEEDEDSQNACVIVSPEASPQLKMIDEQEESQHMVDCKPVDMDIANSDSEDTTIGSWPKDIKTTLPSYSILPQDFTNHFQYNFYMPDFHELSSRPPPPPGVDDYEHAPPPPPYHYFYNSEMQDMELDNEEISEVQRFSEGNSNYYSEIAESKELPSYKIDDDVCNKEESADEEEEEQALRALLLSKFQSPKNQKKSSKIAPCEEDRSTSKEHETTENSDNNIKQKKPTEFILKEAVKRLKIHSQSDNIKGGEPVAKLNNNNQDNSYRKTIESKENNSESSNLLATLRNRLLKCKDQNKTIDSGEKMEKSAEILKDEGDSFPHKFNNPEYANESKPIFPSNTEVANTTVDISDITRRLQKIKEDVLNATNKQILSAHIVNLDDSSRNEDKSEEFIETLDESTCRGADEEKMQLDNLNDRNQQVRNNIAASTNDFKNCIVREKTVEANFDATTKQTTLKVTIKNDDHLKSENKETNVANNEIPLKENSVNNVSKSITNTKSKTSIIAHRDVLNCNKSTESKSATKTQFTASLQSSLIITPVAVRASEIPASTKFSMSRTTKIIKPNKVINTNVEFKRREIAQSNETPKPLKVPRQDPNTKSTNSIDNTRLITSLDQVKHMCKVAPFIINTQNSSNESSEDEWGDYDSFHKPLYDYNDNASPLSLNLESPSFTPLRSNSPTDLSFNTQNSIDSEKTPAQNLTTENLNFSTNATKPKDINRVEKTNKTPLAVRHLPAAAQSEYRRLVHRMMLLENKRKSTIAVDESKQTADKGKKNENISLSLEDGNKADADSTSKASLVKKVLIRNANNTTSSTSLAEIKGSTESVKVHKTNILRSYENLYVKIGAGIVNNLDKSLKLVGEAKRAKISKLKIENRIRELKSEMEFLQSQHKEEQQKISRIYPTICTTNEVISSLKQKRSKVFKAAINLGKTVKGEDYRLNNDLKERINLKSKQLATEIKMVNSLKIQDLSNIENIPKQNSIKELEDNKKGVEEDSKKKSISENNEKISMPEPRTTNDLIYDGKDNKENYENSEESKSNIHLSHTSTDVHVAGNTEFQNAGPDIPNKNKIQSGNRCALEEHDDNGDDNSGEKKSLKSYISPLEHLRNINSNMDPNGVICPYDLMGHCEDVTCKYVHISSEEKP